MNFEQLRALAAVVDEGTFEAAADRLHISPSAVSQRIKALENAEGQILIRRGVPCSPTEPGAVLLRLARQMQLLEAEARETLGSQSPGPGTTRLAVNADSLATWFLPVLTDAAEWADTTLDLHIEDQDHSSRLLRQGEVMGAVTSDRTPANGCRAVRLGAMRYVPAAAPGLRGRFAGAAGQDWDAMPVLQFNAKDDLQRGFLASLGKTGTPPKHTVPSSGAFLAALRAGLGWGMVPELQAGSDFDEGRLVRLDPAAHRDVVLYWQSWALQSRRLDRLTEAVRRAARQLRR